MRRLDCLSPSAVVIGSPQSCLPLFRFRPSLPSSAPSPEDWKGDSGAECDAHHDACGDAVR